MFPDHFLFLAMAFELTRENFVFKNLNTIFGKTAMQTRLYVLVDDHP